MSDTPTIFDALCFKVRQEGKCDFHCKEKREELCMPNWLCDRAIEILDGEEND